LKSVAAKKEVRLYEWRGTDTLSKLGNARDAKLYPVDLNVLAKAIMAYEGDGDTWAHLLALTRRLKAGKQEGFALVTFDGKPVHFCWTTPIHCYFARELRTKLYTEDKLATLIFDCYMPPSVRDETYACVALRVLAQRLMTEGKAPWTLTIGNQWRSRVEDAGFAPRYALFLERTPMGRRVTRVEFCSAEGEETCPRV
jgi:hypothetical protein